MLDSRSHEPTRPGVGTGPISPGTFGVPVDCVRCYPVVGSDASAIVYFDSAGEPTLEIRMKTANLRPEWERWMLRWGRDEERRRRLEQIRVVK